MIISGYRHKQSILLSRIMEKMTQFEVDHRRFAIHKETLARQLKNFHANQPYRYAHVDRRTCMCTVLISHKCSTSLHIPL